MSNLFFELTIILILAGGIATLISVLKQPPLIAYILAGLIIGPLGYYHLQHAEILQSLSEVGITLLLFLVGLELDPSHLKKLGSKVILIGIGQLVVTAALAWLLLSLLGFSGLGAWLLAAGLTFSSTIIAVKLLTEKRDIDGLYGRITVGVLLLQDFAAIILLIILGTSNSTFSGLGVWQSMLVNIVRLILFVWLLHWVSTYLLPYVFKIIGKSSELLLIFSLAWALGLAAFAASPLAGLNLEIGGFLAGLMLARTALHFEVSRRVESVRDFFIIIFFISLGAGLHLNSVRSAIVPGIILAAFVLIIKPLVIMVLSGLNGYKARTSYMTAASLSHVSEFSLVLVALSARLGFVSEAVAGIFTLAALISIAAATYSLNYADVVYNKLRPVFRRLQLWRGFAEQDDTVATLKHHVVLIGAHRVGQHIAEVLQKTGAPFIVIDHNPEVIKQYTDAQVVALCGDIADDHIQELANVRGAKIIISTIPHVAENKSLLYTLRQVESKARVIMTAADEDDARALYDAGASYVLLPHFIGGQHMAKLLEDDHTLKSLQKLKIQHLRTLQQN